jgi:hypothetical protein
MPPMRVTDIAASPAHIDKARERFSSLRAAQRFLRQGVIYLIAGAGLLGLSLWLNIAGPAGGMLIAVIAGVVGATLILFGGIRLIGFRILARATRELEQVISRELSNGVVDVQIDAARAFTEESDGEAVVLSDGHGGGVYIQSQILAEHTVNGEVPASWHLVLFNREGGILECTTSGPRLKLEQGPAARPFSNPEPLEAVVLPVESTPSDWRELLGQ